MQARAHLLRLQKTLYGRFQASARTALGSPSPSLRRYFERYQREFQTFHSVITDREFLNALVPAEILICGDYHTLGQAQRMALELLQSLRTHPKSQQKQVLALEMLPSRCTPWTEAFLTGRMSEKEFLEKVAYAKNWGFRWENYKPLFDFARAHQIPVIGLNLASGKNAGTLQKRDEHAARVLARMRESHPLAKIFVLFGDLHLAASHLPLSLDRELKRKGLTARVAVVHQNAESLYWKLARKKFNLDNAIVKLGKDRYCVLNVAPWVKLQSYLEWLEASRDDGDLPSTPNHLVAVEDWNDYIDELRRTLAAFLKIRKLRSADFSLVSVADQLAVARMQKYFHGRSRKWKLISDALRKTPCLLLDEGPWLCVRKPTPNQLAALSASLLHRELAHGYPRLDHPKKDFYRWVWAEALSFLGSKIIHPYRTCWGITDYEFFVAQPKVPTPWLKTVAAYFDRERQFLNAPGEAAARLFSVTALPVYYFFAARAVGKILGDALYRGFVSNHISQQEIAALFSASLVSREQSYRRYFKWVRRLDKLSLRTFARYSKSTEKK